MHWLFSLDHALFHFINSTLANPFFDRVMPILSGNGVPWLLAVLLAAPLVWFFGSMRLRVCVVLIALAVAIGDPLVVGTVKSLVERPRPFITQPDARLFGKPGKGYVKPLPDGSLPVTANRRSFPSAHAANMCTVAIIAFFFYRRSGWFLFPLAAAVAFSRVYNGVHYPTDVLAGAILGAVYAFAFLLAAHALWDFPGQRFFPAAYSRLPDLLNPQTDKLPGSKSEIRDPKSEIDWLHLGYILIFVTLIARWIYIHSGIINLSGDEAYQWIWSKHLALSYYSKPLGIALLQKLGTLIGGDTEFGVRFCSPLIAAIMGILVLHFLARETSPRTAFFALVATFAVPLLCVGSVLITIDPPLALCWMWATIAGWRAISAKGTAWDWFVVGLAMGLGFLCKYMAAAQIACWIIIFALMPSARLHLKKPGPWLALVVFLICTLPVIIWNAQNHWVTLGHVAYNAGLTKNGHFTLSYFGDFSAQEFGLLDPVFFIAVLWAGFAFWKRRTEKLLWLFLACMGLPLFYGCWLWSFHSRVQPNHPAAAIAPMFCLAAVYFHEHQRIAKKILIAGLIIGFPVVALIHSTSLTKPLLGGKLPGDVDIAHRLYGWRETAQVVEAEHKFFGTNSFILADDYQAAGLYTFYSPSACAAVTNDTPLVYCLRDGAPTSQFYLWDNYDYQKHRKGQNAIYIQHLEYYKLEKGWLWKWLKHEKVDFRDVPSKEKTPKFLTEQFQSVTNLGIHEIKISDGRVFHRIQIYGCYGLK
ncbi:MAG TPA: glycosyltransferase family 39 protein [Candidatus Sulfotelmatobacter sp.]|nr:glycosyltransferase family 39 protein [Candidatus Sulfotelmatobacter sp.]